MKNFKKCLFTGSTGSGASFLIEYILKKNKKVKIFGLYRSKGYKKILNKNARVKLINIDLNNKSKLQKILKRINPESFITLLLTQMLEGLSMIHIK